MRKQKSLWRFFFFGFIQVFFSLEVACAQPKMWHSARTDGHILFSVFADTLIALDSNLYLIRDKKQNIIFRNHPFQPVLRTSLDFSPCIPGWTLISDQSHLQLVRNQTPESPLPIKFSRVETWHLSLLGQTDKKWVWQPGSPFELWADSVHIHPNKLVLFQDQGIVLVDTTLKATAFPIRGEKRLLSPHFTYVLTDSVWQPIGADHRAMIQKRNGFWWNDTSLVDSSNRQIFMQTSHRERTLIGDSVSILHPNFLFLRRQGKNTLITSTGAKLKLFKNFKFSLIADTLIAVSMDKGNFIVTVSGRKTKLNRTITAVKGVSDGLIMAKDKKRFGFVDMNGFIRIACRYDSLLPFYQGLAGAKINNRWGFVNRDEKIIVQPHFQEVLGPREKLYAVNNDGKWGLLRTDGEMVLSCQFDAIQPSALSGWYVKKGNWQGWANENGRVMIQPKYFSTIELAFGKISLTRNNEKGLVDSEGTTILPIDYQYIIIDPGCNRILFY